jgi:uncharacterized membrane protein
VGVLDGDDDSYGVMKIIITITIMMMIMIMVIIIIMMMMMMMWRSIEEEMGMRGRSTQRSSRMTSILFRHHSEITLTQTSKRIPTPS